MDDQAIQKITDSIMHLDKRFTDSIDRLDKRFDEQDKRMDERFTTYDRKLDERFDHHTKVTLSYMDQRFGKVEDRLENLGGKFSGLQSSVDGFAKRVTDLEQESVAHSAYHRRLENRS